MTTVKRKELFSLLHKQLSEKESGSEDTPNRRKKVPRKSTRKIQMGWLHNGTQIKKKKGGGTRKVDVDREACKAELIELGKDMFFPEDTSTMGNIDEFHFDIFYSKQTPLKDNKVLKPVLS
jgi:hypothetical protein